MASDMHSFDIGSKIDYQEMDNAINQTQKEVETRYDLRDANSDISLNKADHKLQFQAVDEFRLVCPRHGRATAWNDAGEKE